MRIGIVLAKAPGYSETFFRSMIKGLRQEGIGVTLFVQKADPLFDLCEVRPAPKVYRNGFALGFSLLGQFTYLLPQIRAVSRFWKLERKDGKTIVQVLKSIYLNAHILSARPDWLHFGFATMALERENLAGAIGAKMAVSLRGYDINVYPLKHPACYDRLWKRVDKVHSISDYLLKRAFELGLKTSTPFSIISPAVDLSKIPTPKTKKSSSNCIELLTVARLHWIKGLDLALHAVKLLKDKGMDAHYTIIGDGPKKDYERYAYLALILGIQDRVHFAGKHTHIETLKKMAACDIYLQPSLNEGFCNAVLEAQAIGVPVAASRVGGLTENVEEGRSGWLFETGNYAQLADLLASISTMPEIGKQKVTGYAVNRVGERFNLKLQQKQFRSFFGDKINTAKDG